MQQRRAKLPRGTAGCTPTSALRQKSSGGISWEGPPLHEHLLEEILLTGFLAPSWGTRCPLVVPWSPASALAVMLESFPVERAP